MPPQDETALSLVFVQSNDGNTERRIRNPSEGPTDKHLIYEGLSRVAADAVLAGARTVHAGAFFSVWHPELFSCDARSSCHGIQRRLSSRRRAGWTSTRCCSASPRCPCS